MFLDFKLYGLMQSVAFTEINKALSAKIPL